MANKNQHPTLTGSEILWATLVGEGVTTVFGYPHPESGDPYMIYAAQQYQGPRA